MTANARRPLRHLNRLTPIRPFVAPLVGLVVLAMLLPSIGAVLAPIIAVLLLVGWWLLGFGLALATPFAVVTAVSIVAER
ncbi:hypothetical protein [Haloferax sp. DFSO60]|uniref:hypothetical protein n=1 Tax=Haloferax sp. DFSO60 TaxID=3388652 RepID=UPI00397BC5F6